ncbi:hypothetical protein BSKO_00253 [Bryopsis sp. KO-2023]|nr:hypothetical protein BSKO_00253 [Bryopsis sp. KO-2023]
MISLKLVAAVLLALCSTLPAYSKRASCPTKRLAKGKIQGGTDAEPGRYPYATSLQRHRHSGKHDPKDHFCGGVLIAEDLVVTAAHCVHPGVPGSETFPMLHIGGRDLVDDVDTEIRETCRTIVHQDFDPEDITKGFDIALLMLDSKTTKTPAKLDISQAKSSVGKAKVVGWGKDATKPFFLELQEVELVIVQNDECKVQVFDGVTSSMMCAQGNNSDVCKGDSGGGLVKVSNGCGENDVLIGLTSFGYECTDTVKGQGRSPGVYTRIFDFCEWLYKLGGKESTIYENPDCELPAFPEEIPDDVHPRSQNGKNSAPKEAEGSVPGGSPESGGSEQDGPDSQAPDEDTENVQQEEEALLSEIKPDSDVSQTYDDPAANDAPVSVPAAAGNTPAFQYGNSGDFVF